MGSIAGNIAGAAVGGLISKSGSKGSSAPVSASPYAGLQGDIANRLKPFLDQQQLPYAGPRIAPFSADQLAGIMGTRQTAASYNPIAQQAGNLIGAASGLDPALAKGIMSPYISGVVDEIGRQGNDNLMRNILPNINDQFIKSGQFKSSRHGDITTDAIAKTQREISGLQSQALQSGFSDVMNRALQSAQLGANLGTSSRQGLLSTGQMQQGEAQRNLDLAYSDFLRQFGYPLQNLQQINSFGQSTANAPYYTPQNGNSLANGLGGALAGWKIGGGIFGGGSELPPINSPQPLPAGAQYVPDFSWNFARGGRVRPYKRAGIAYKGF